MTGDGGWAQPAAWYKDNPKPNREELVARGFGITKAYLQLVKSEIELHIDKVMKANAGLHSSPSEAKHRKLQKLCEMCPLVNLVRDRAPPEWFDNTARRLLSRAQENASRKKKAILVDCASFSYGPFTVSPAQPKTLRSSTTAPQSAAVEALAQSCSKVSKRPPTRNSALELFQDIIAEKNDDIGVTELKPSNKANIGIFVTVHGKKETTRVIVEAKSILIDRGKNASFDSLVRIVEVEVAGLRNLQYTTQWGGAATYVYNDYVLNLILNDLSKNNSNVLEVTAMPRDPPLQTPKTPPKTQHSELNQKRKSPKFSPLRFGTKKQRLARSITGSPANRRLKPFL